MLMKISEEYFLKGERKMLIIDPRITDERILKGEALFKGRNKGYCEGCGVAVDADIDNYCWNCRFKLDPARPAESGERRKS